MNILCIIKGWMPGYLIMNMTGPSKYKGKNVNHFSPTATFFKPEEYWLIVQSNIAFAMALGLLSFCIYTFGKTPFKVSTNTSFCTEVSLKNEFLNFSRFHASGCILSDSVHDRQLSLSAHYVSPAH